MENQNKLLAKIFIVVIMLVILVSMVGIMSMCHKPVVLQGQVEATEIRISGKLPGRIDTFYVSEGQRVKVGDTLVLINSPEAWAKLQQATAMENVAKFQNEK
ncbi:MAG: biotin/lipoyl-binding protein, partial [Paludibacteraceae bacterium]|nr:biotin/lipoyl-binding protein [Paludibacteraceae bacterium]